MLRTSVFRLLTKDNPILTLSSLEGYCGEWKSDENLAFESAASRHPNYVNNKAGALILGIRTPQVQLELKNRFPIECALAVDQPEPQSGRKKMRVVDFEWPEEEKEEDVGLLRELDGFLDMEGGEEEEEDVPPLVVTPEETFQWEGLDSQ
jgi:hypothetical protein